MQVTLILSAARAVFLERGAMGTTSEVAARAGVSEGTIFNRFKSKEMLFRAAMHPVHARPLRRRGLHQHVPGECAVHGERRGHDLPAER